MKYSISTLGCPKWDLKTIVTRADEYGFDGVDFRGLEDEIDVTQTAAFTTDIKSTKRTFADAGVEISGISTGIHICELENIDRHREEARRTIPIAGDIDARNLRVFGQGDSETYGTAELAEIGQQLMEDIFELDGARQFQWNIETHDNWIRSQDCERLIDAVDDSNVGVLWDVGHTSRVGNESPAETLDRLGDRISYVHVKDAVYDPDHPDAMDDGWRYVFPGDGELPLETALISLREHGFNGWIVFEHEKRWHPELADPETVFPRFADWVHSVV